MGRAMKKSGVNELMSYQSIIMGESLPSKCKILYKWGKHTKVGIYLTWENTNKQVQFDFSFCLIDDNKKISS